jgi:hypothetical protein
MRSAGDLGELDGHALERGEYTTNPCWSQVAASMSLAGTMGFPVSLREVVGAAHRVPLGGFEAGADGGGPHVDRVEVLLRVAQELDLAVQRGGEGVELLADRHGDRVLQLRAAHLDDLEVRVALGPEGGGELLQLRHQLLVAQDEGDLDRGGVRVVGGLRHVQVVVRLDDL